MEGFCAEGTPVTAYTGCSARGCWPGSTLHTQSCFTCALALNVQAQDCPRSLQCQEIKMPSRLCMMKHSQTNHRKVSVFYPIEPLGNCG